MGFGAGTMLCGVNRHGFMRMAAVGRDSPEQGRHRDEALGGDVNLTCYQANLLIYWWQGHTHNVYIKH